VSAGAGADGVIIKDCHLHCATATYAWYFASFLCGGTCLLAAVTGIPTDN